MSSLSKVSALFLIVIFIYGPLRAQEPPTVLINGKPTSIAVPDVRFDVVSIRPHGIDASDLQTVEMVHTHGGFHAQNVTLRQLVANACSINVRFVEGGPAWVDSRDFDVEAKVAPEDIPRLATLPVAQRRAMLQPVLAERFGVIVEFSQKTAPALQLVALNGGKKLVPTQKRFAPDEVAKASGDMRRGHISLKAATIFDLQMELSFVLQRRVVDTTGLAGRYDIELSWTPDSDEASFGDPAGKPDVGPSLYTALQEQLGLKLIPGKSLTPSIAIKSAHLPSPN